MEKETVLAATDLREASDEALRQAHQWAQRRNARFVVCHILPRMVGSEMLFPQAIEREAIDQASFERRAAGVLRRRAETVTGRPSDELDVVVSAGSAHTEILRIAEQQHASVIVVGSHGHGVMARIFLGDVAERVAREARCPVLIARRHEATRRIVAATDFSRPSEDAVRIAAEEARLRDARLTLVTSIEGFMRDVAWMSEFGAVGNFVEDEYQAERRKVAEQLRQLLERVRSHGDVEVNDVSPAAAVVEAASRLPAELIVSGAVARGRAERRELGHVADKIVRHAPCSVLVVREVATAS